MDGCPTPARRTVGNPTVEQAISWNSNDIGGGETGRARRAENSMTGVMQRRSEHWLPVAWRPARPPTVLAACIGRIRANISRSGAFVRFAFYS